MRTPQIAAMELNSWINRTPTIPGAGTPGIEVASRPSLSVETAVAAGFTSIAGYGVGPEVTLTRITPDGTAMEEYTFRP